MNDLTRWNPASAIRDFIVAALTLEPSRKPTVLAASGSPRGWPTPRHDHISGMRRKAIVEGRRRFKVNGKTRRV